MSFADLNNNGQQDIFTVIGGALEGDVYMNTLFENPGNDKAVNRFYRVTEFSDEPELLDQQSFQFNTTPTHHTTP